MPPELFTLIDKITFTSALLIAVYFLYRDSRGDSRAATARNTDDIARLTANVAALTSAVAILVDHSTIAIKDEVGRSH